MGEKVTFLVGSAASLASPSCMPSASQLKTGMVNRIAGKLPPALAAMILTPGGGLGDMWQKLALEVLFQQMRRELGDLALEPLDVFRTQQTETRFNFVHLALAALADRFDVALLTTNWDVLIEHAVSCLGLVCHPIVFGSPTAPSSARAGGQVELVKLHGSVDAHGTVVATVDQAGLPFSDRQQALVGSTIDGGILCLVGYGANDYDVYHAIRASRARELFIVLRRPSGHVDPVAFQNRHARLLALLNQSGGVPVVCDILDFSETLLSSTRPQLHRRQRHLLQEAANPPDTDWCNAVWDAWASKVSDTLAHRIVGDIYHFLGDGVSSTIFYQGALAGKPSSRRRRERAGGLIRLSIGQCRAGQYGTGAATASSALWASLAARDRLLASDALYAYADARWLDARGKSLRALLAFGACGILYLFAPEPSSSHGRASCLQHVCLYAQLLPPWRVLRPLLRQGLRGLERSYRMFFGPNGNALRLIARTYWMLGDIEKALDKGMEALEICSWYGDGTGSGNCHRELASIWLSSCERRGSAALDEAAFHFHEALSIAHRLNDPISEAKAQAGLEQVLLAQRGTAGSP